MTPNFVRRAALATAAAAALLATASSALAEPALWKATGAHGATVYLFGTVHVLKPTTVWRSPKIDAAFAASKTLWEEIKDADDQAAAQPLIMKYGIDPAHPLSTKIGPEGEAKLAAVGAPYGVQAAQLEPLRPWTAGLTFTMLPLTKAGYDPKSGVDVKLKAEAAAEGKDLKAFETMEQQIRFFADLPQDTEVQFLLATLDDVEKGPGALDQLVDAWAAGDVDKIGALMISDMQAKYPALYKLLLADRNQDFANQLKAVLEGGPTTVFVAVGAAHLAGPDSVEADLEKLGFKVVRQ